MHISQLTCANYKCYTSVDLRFTASIVAFTGPNGSGKTNLLDAIYYLCVGKSYFNPIDQQNFKHGTDYFRLVGTFQQGSAVDEVVVANGGGKRKRIMVNNVLAKSRGEHLGRFPVVVIAPDDITLITGGSEERRNFIDFLLSFANASYLQLLLDYNRLLKQRNQTLKRMAEQGQWNKDWLTTYDTQLVPVGTAIYKERQKFLAAFTPLFLAHYTMLAPNEQEPSLIYESPLSTHTFSEILQQRLERDRLLQRTTSGIHRDDLAMMLSGHEVKKFGSQGQKKSFLIALKLAAWEWLAQQTGKLPLLLLDDLFDKLDEHRSGHLLRWVEQQSDAQVFITHTNYEVIKALFTDVDKSVAHFFVNAGVAEPA